MNDKRRKKIRIATEDLKEVFFQLEKWHKKFEETREEIGSIFDEEQTSFDNIPESLLETESAVDSESKLEELAEVLQNLETIHDTFEEFELKEIIEQLQNIVAK